MNIPSPGSPLSCHMANSSSSGGSKSAHKTSGGGGLHSNHKDSQEPKDEKSKKLIIEIVGWIIMISVFTLLILWLTNDMSSHTDTEDPRFQTENPHKISDMDEDMVEYLKWRDSLLNDTNSYLYKSCNDTLYSPQTTHSKYRHRHSGYSSDDYEYDDGYGYDANGYDRYGYDRDGYDDEGFDEEGYDDEGFDEEGYDEDGIDEDGYDEDGNYEDTY